MISVYGGTGFIGSNYIQFYDWELDLAIIPRDGTIPDPRSKQIIYFISTTHNYNVFDNLHLDVDTNLTHFLSVLEMWKKYAPSAEFTFISSWFVYGDTDTLPAREDSICRPKGFYSITKKCAEDLLISFATTFGLKYRIVRLANVYGAGDVASKKKNALQYLIGEIKNNNPINLYNNGNFVRDYIHVKDVCDALFYCMNFAEPNQVFNLGSGNPTKFYDIMNYARRITGSDSIFFDVEPADFHKIVQVENMFLDVSKLKSLGFEPRISLWDGIKELCQ